MKKHLFAIFVYSATFLTSVFLVGLLTPEKIFTPTSCFSSHSRHSNKLPIVETGQQAEIRNLLRLDQKYGNRYFSGAEKAADTDRLVSRMRSLDTSSVPAAVREAYENHTEAWNDYAEHLNSSKDHTGSERECVRLNGRINATYDEVLNSARKYGVYFKP